MNRELAILETMECGCDVIEVTISSYKSHQTEYEIEYCPKHGAVDDLLKALKKAQWGCGCCGCPECHGDELYHHEHEKGCSIGNAIAKAEGKNHE